PRGHHGPDWGPPALRHVCCYLSRFLREWHKSGEESTAPCAAAGERKDSRSYVSVDYFRTSDVYVLSDPIAHPRGRRGSKCGEPDSCRAVVSEWRSLCYPTNCWKSLRVRPCGSCASCRMVREQAVCGSRLQSPTSAEQTEGRVQPAFRHVLR